VDVWRRLYEPLEQGMRSFHSLKRRLGLEAGLAPPRMSQACRPVGRRHTQRHVLAMGEEDYAVH
jgi:hypothetical protein